MSAIIAAAVAFPALLITYLLKLRRRPFRVSSTLFWERAARDLEVNAPFRWLRPSWLLVFHLLILSLLVLALGRPAFRGVDQSFRRIILVIDRSASMSAMDSPADRTRLAEATENPSSGVFPNTASSCSIPYVPDRW